jgi:putative transposase
VITKHPQYGVKRIKKELEETYHLNLGRDTLGKLLKLWSLSLKRKVAPHRPTMLQKILLQLVGWANLLIRTTLTAPLQALTSDITELKFKGGKAYLCVHKDAYGQMVYGYSLGITMETALVLTSLNMARKTLNYLGVTKALKILCHQDRGSQYTSYPYVQAVLSFGRLSYSDPGTPTHNPGQESFFGRFKADWAEEIAEIETFEDLEKFVKVKIKYYNHERRHTSIGLVAPWTFTKSFLKNRR